MRLRGKDYKCIPKVLWLISCGVDSPTEKDDLRVVIALLIFLHTYTLGFKETGATYFHY